MAMGIRDKVAILGMGCTKFGERWDVGSEELMYEALQETLADAGIEKKDIQAAWLGSALGQVNLGFSAIPLSIALRLRGIPVTRVENYCATGTEALRGAGYAVASGACDIAMAMGVEKLKDCGYGGTPVRGSMSGSLEFQIMANFSTPGLFAQVATGYAAKHNIPMGDLKRALAHVSVKSHANGALNRKAHLRRAVTVEEVLAAPMISYPLGLFDSCGVSDGAACAIVTTPEIARALGKKDIITIKALQLALSDGTEQGLDNWDVDHFTTTNGCSIAAYKEAGITNPREEISMMEVHDCFSITELITMEDLHISARGGAVKDVMDGLYNIDGKIPCQPDGGLKCFGHPVGASGLRMVYEMYSQLMGRAGKRQLSNPRYGLTHNLGGPPHKSVCCISIIGRLGD